MEPKTGILIHGRHLQTAGWVNLVWGRPPDLLGQLPMGVLVAALENAMLIALGTGASEIDGKLEAEFTRDYLFDNFHRLSEFTAFLGFDLEHLEARIHNTVRLDTKSQNTRQEVVECARIMAGAGVNRIIRVSAPTRIPRCLLEALVQLPKHRETAELAANVWAVPSHVPYLGRSAADVLVIEPPHRGDADNDAEIEIPAPSRCRAHEGPSG